jgi:hypothetical protein
VEKQLQMQREMQREDRGLQREREERQLQMFQGDDELDDSDCNC